MTTHYVVEERPGKIEIAHKPTDYTLIIDLTNKDMPLQIVKYAFEILFLISRNGNEVKITGRDFEKYNPQVQNLQIDTSLQYIEVGAGLGEFIPRLVRIWGRRLLHKPIVIDPADYILMRHMLAYARNLGVSDRINEHLETLVERCNIVLDTGKVRLINLSLGKALTEYPNLESIADIVVDQCGPSLYSSTEMHNGEEISDRNLLLRIIELERRLLKPNGSLIISS